MGIKLIAMVVAFMLSVAVQAKVEEAVDASHLKYSAEVTLVSQGKRLPAIFYGAAGAGPHPTIILLHGYPGNEKNLDIAQGMRDAGWNVIFFHYRGAWGAEGQFSFTGAEEDVTAVTKQLQQPEMAQKYKIDPARISYVGHSMGGHMAVAGILDNPEIRCSVVYDGANLGVIFTGGGEELKAMWRDYSDSLFMLNGWSGKKNMDEIRTNGEQLNLLNRAHKIGTRPILFVPADSVLINIKDIDAIANAMRKVEGNQVHYELIKDDHSFNNNRAKLLAVTREFLNAHCR